MPPSMYTLYKARSTVPAAATMMFWLSFKRCKADADRLKIRHEWPGAPGAGIKSRARLPERGARQDLQHICGHFLWYVKNFSKN